MIALIFLCVWLGFGVIAELIGAIYYNEWNGLKNCIIIICFGLISMLGVISEIQDEEFEKRY